MHAMTVPYDKRMDQVPIRADMATIINGPTGMVEASIMSKTAPAISSGVYHKRKAMQERLIKQLVAEHGTSDPQVAVVIRKEVESSGLMRADSVTPGGLKSLEAKVAAAVHAARPPREQITLKPPPTYARPMAAGELAEKVKSVSNWTDVAMHRNGYYNVEQQRKISEKEAKKVELSVQLKHQMAMKTHQRAAQKALVAEEARQVAAELASYEADMAAERQKRAAKVEVEKATRSAQTAEQAARRAAERRLQQLEDEEMEAFLKQEMEADRVRKAAKQKANDEYHRATAKANVEAEVRRQAEQKAMWDEEAKLNATWKAILDKQEADRNAVYTNLRERIHRMQRVYESSAGADLERRLKEEEATREAWIEAHEKQVDAQLVAKQAKRRANIQANLDFNQELMASRRREREREAGREREYAASVAADIKEGEVREAERLALKQARKAQQASALNEQVALQKANAAADPGSAEMTPIEATINRPLLVSIAQHQYHAGYTNPLTG